MTHAFLVTSSIEVDPNKMLKGAKLRTAFNSAQRLEQTIATLHRLRVLDPTAAIYLIDNSANTYTELNSLGLPNFTYVKLQDLSPTVTEITRTYSSKSHCESIMVLEFLKHFKQQLKQYDFVTKVSGRYIPADNFNTDLFVPENKNKFFFKKEMIWSGPQIDFLSEEHLPRDMLVDGKLHGVYTVIHGMGTEKLDQYELLLMACAQGGTEYSKYYYQDVEYIVHMCLRLFNQLKDVVYVDWTIDGMCGATGNSMRY
jgi:hypothetical protein